MIDKEIRSIALDVAKKVYGIRQEVDYEEVFNVEEDKFHLQLCARFLSAISEAEPVAIVSRCRVGQWEITPTKHGQSFSIDQPLFAAPLEPAHKLILDCDAMRSEILRLTLELDEAASNCSMYKQQVLTLTKERAKMVGDEGLPS